VDSDTAVVTFKFACLPDRGHCTMSHPSAALAPHCIEPSDGRCYSYDKPFFFNRIDW